MEEGTSWPVSPGRAPGSDPDWAPVQSQLRALASDAISRGDSGCLCDPVVAVLRGPSLQDDGQRGDFIKPTEQADGWGPFTGEGVFTESLCGARICSETRFPYTQAGRCWSSYPSPAPNFFTGYCYLSKRT